MRKLFKTLIVVLLAPGGFLVSLVTGEKEPTKVVHVVVFKDRDRPIYVSAPKMLIPVDWPISQSSAHGRTTVVLSGEAKNVPKDAAVHVIAQTGRPAPTITNDDEATGSMPWLVSPAIPVNEQGRWKLTWTFRARNVIGITATAFPVGCKPTTGGLRCPRGWHPRRY